jgi:DNA polymerase III delta prime subunit
VSLETPDAARASGEHAVALQGTAFASPAVPSPLRKAASRDAVSAVDATMRFVERAHGAMDAFLHEENRLRAAFEESRGDAVRQSMLEAEYASLKLWYLRTHMQHDADFNLVRGEAQRVAHGTPKPAPAIQRVADSQPPALSQASTHSRALAPPLPPASPAAPEVEIAAAPAAAYGAPPRAAASVGSSISQAPPRRLLTSPAAFEGIVHSREPSPSTGNASEIVAALFEAHGLGIPHRALFEPEIVAAFGAQARAGALLITGPEGAGKTTAMLALVQRVVMSACTAREYGSTWLLPLRISAWLPDGICDLAAAYRSFVRHTVLCIGAHAPGLHARGAALLCKYLEDAVTPAGVTRPPPDLATLFPDGVASWQLLAGDVRSTYRGAVSGALPAGAFFAAMLRVPLVLRDALGFDTVVVALDGVDACRSDRRLWVLDATAPAPVAVTVDLESLLYERLLSDPRVRWVATSRTPHVQAPLPRGALRTLLDCVPCSAVERDLGLPEIWRFGRAAPVHVRAVFGGIPGFIVEAAAALRSDDDHIRLAIRDSSAEEAAQACTPDRRCRTLVVEGARAVEGLLRAVTKAVSRYRVATPATR